MKNSLIKNLKQNGDLKKANECEVKSKEINQSKNRQKNLMNNIKDMWDNIKGRNTCVTEVQEGKRGKMELKKFQKIGNFSHIWQSASIYRFMKLRESWVGKIQRKPHLWTWS